MIAISMVTQGLTVVTGCMFAGKTGMLIDIIDKLERSRKKVLVFTPEIDTRYDSDHIVSHSGAKHPALQIKAPDDIWGHLKEYQKVKVVVFDEAQFFDNSIISTVRKLLDADYLVVVGGLNQNFRGDPFGGMPDLLAMADYIISLYPVCEVCGGTATRTQRLINGKPASRKDEEVVIGADEAYQARCPSHHEVLDNSTKK